MMKLIGREKELIGREKVDMTDIGVALEWML
jgi:hypothetical protein